MIFVVIFNKEYFNLLSFSPRPVAEMLRVFIYSDYKNNCLQNEKRIIYIN